MQCFCISRIIRRVGYGWNCTSGYCSVLWTCLCFNSENVIYGWPDLQNEDVNLTDEAHQILTLFTGVMMGSQVASEALKILSNAFTQQVAIRLPKQDLTKYAIYNISKQVAKWIGIRLTKDSFSKGISKVIPIMENPVSASLTYLAFMPMANKLKKYLDDELQVFLINMSVRLYNFYVFSFELEI